MADFPSIEPFRRSYSLPVFPLEQEESWPGIATRYKTGRRGMASGVTISLTYEDIREDDMQRIRNHWRSQMGGVIGFNVPAVVWGGIGSLPLGGLRFRYTSPPEETQEKGGWYDITIELESFNFTAAVVDTLTAAIIVRSNPIQVAAGGPMTIPPAGRLVIQGIAPNLAEPGVQINAAAGKIITKPPTPRVVVGVGIIPPAGRSITRGVPPTATAGGGAGASPYVAQIVTAFNVHVVGPIPGLLLPVPPARVITRARLSTVGNAGVVVLLPTVPIITRGRGQAVVLSSAGLTFPPPGRTISRGRAPGAPGVGFVCPPSKVVLRGRVPGAPGVGFVCPPSKVVLRGRVPAVTGG